jgi:hypothetical protein
MITMYMIYAQAKEKVGGNVKGITIPKIDNYL